VIFGLILLFAGMVIQPNHWMVRGLFPAEWLLIPAGVGFTGVGLIALVRPGRLTLSPAGLEYRLLLSTRLIPWGAVQNVGLYSYRRREGVSLRLNSGQTVHLPGGWPIGARELASQIMQARAQWTRAPQGDAKFGKSFRGNKPPKDGQAINGGAGNGSDGMSSSLDQAAEMPLLDAAYALWRARCQLDPLDIAESIAKPDPVGQPHNFDDVRRLIPSVIQNLRAERAHGHEGPTFQRLKSVHPEATDAELQEAIKAAIKLEADCLRHYRDDVAEAVNLARAENPEFGEITYERLYLDMRQAMR
jgi:hypothetical protein